MQRALPPSNADQPDDSQAPPYGALLREMGEIIDIRRFWRKPAWPADAPEGGMAPVVVLPGFLAAAVSTAMLRKALAKAGYDVRDWGLGRNLGIRADIFERIDRQLDGMGWGSDVPVNLVGWSLGGLIAREYAKYAPSRVARVITLGSPFSGDIRANHAWRLYELVNRHKVDNMPIPVVLAEKPPVKTIALWSPRDGVVAPASSRGLGDEADHRIEVGCGHIGFVTRAESFAAILQALKL